jgi:hypothetical protein
VDAGQANSGARDLCLGLRCRRLYICEDDSEFLSPTSWVPPVIAIAIAARTRKVAQYTTIAGWYGAGAPSFSAPMYVMRFQTFDYDGNLMGVYNPSFDGKTQQNFSAKS